MTVTRAVLNSPRPVAEHGARRRAAELLDIGAAETARLHADEQPGAGRLGCPPAPASSESRTTARTAVS
jgi:hypothetical protein